MFDYRKQVKWGKPRPEVITSNRNQKKARTKAKERQAYLRTNQSK